MTLIADDGGEIELRVSQRGQRAEDERHHHRDRTCKDQHPPVHPNLVEARNLRRGKAKKPARSHHRQENSQPAPSGGEEQTLREECPQQLAATCPEGSAYRDLTASRLGAHDEQVQDIHHGNEEHEPDGAHDDPQHLCHVTHHGIFEPFHHGSMAPLLDHTGRQAILRIELRHLMHEHGQLVGRGLERCTRRESAKRLVHEVAEACPGAAECEGNENVGFVE